MTDTTTPASLPVVACILLDQHCRAVDDCEDYERIEIWNDESAGEYLRYEAAGRLERLVRQSDAQTVIDELKAEVERLKSEKQQQALQYLSDNGQWMEQVERLTRERDQWKLTSDSFEDSMNRLLAQPVAARPDIEAVMVLAEDLVVAAMTEADSPSSCKGVENAARSALRAALQALQPADEAKDEKPYLPEWRVDEIAHKHGDYDQRSVCFCFSADSQCRFHIYDFVRDCIDAALTLHQTDTKEQQP